MKLFTKIFLQVACVILILSSAVFFYTSYRWKNQSIQYINNYEYTKFQNNLLQFEEKLRLTSSQSANSDEKVRNRILIYAFRQIFHDSAVLYQNDEELYNGTAYDFDVQGIQEQLGEVELHGKWYDADTYICDPLISKADGKTLLLFFYSSTESTTNLNYQIVTYKDVSDVLESNRILFYQAGMLTLVLLLLTGTILFFSLRKIMAPLTKLREAAVSVSEGNYDIQVPAEGDTELAQVGKSFRNEITPGNFIFRIREFEQMELEFFCKPGTDLEWFAYWRQFCHDWLLNLGLKDENLRLRDHEPEELSFYSKATTDFEFLFPFGWGELWGVADRTDYDLTQHQNVSGKDLTYFDPETNQRYIPYVVEPSLGVERSVLAVLCDAYDEEVVGQDKNGKDDVRVVLRLHPALAPYKAAILPLSKKLSEPAMEIYNELCKDFMLDFDETGSIGKRYRREDEIGTPFCITVDFDTVGDGENPGDQCVTVRERDSMEQVRVPISQLKAYLTEKLAY